MFRRTDLSSYPIYPRIYKLSHLQDHFINVPQINNTAHCEGKYMFEQRAK